METVRLYPDLPALRRRLRELEELRECCGGQRLRRIDIDHEIAEVRSAIQDLEDEDQS